MITLEILKKQLHYNPENGKFMRLITTSSRSIAGSEAGCLDKHNGYINICVLGKYYKAHRLAWLYMNGEFPEMEIDHINRVKHDNSWANLRLATTSQNAMNVSLNSLNKSGTKGVSWAKSVGKWYASIKFNGKSKNLGYYDNLDDAANAYKIYAIANFGEFSCIF